MGSWEKVTLGNLVPSAVTQSLSTATSVVDQFLDTYKAVLNIAKVLQKTLGGSTPDLFGALVDGVVSLIEGLLQAGKIHVLFVPIGKNFPTLNQPTLPLSLDDLGYQVGVDIQSAGIAFSGDAGTAYAALAGGTGGNQGFYTTFLEALNDQGDLNRPQYQDPSTAVAMAVMLLGAPSIAEMVTSAAAFSRIFQPSANSDFMNRTVPVPQDVRGKCVAVPGATTMGAHISWTAPNLTISFPYFPGVSMSVTKYAVIRSTDKRAMKARSVLDLFSTQSLAVGLTSDDAAQSSKVVAIGSGLNSNWVDTDDLDPTVQYYYCVAWRVTVTENSKDTALPWDRVSATVKIDINNASPTQSSVPPDWVARGSALELMPDLAEQVELVLEQIKTLSTRNTGGASGAVSNALDLIEKSIDTFATKIDQLKAAEKRINAIFSSPIPALYATVISGTGGNTFLAGELASRLYDTSDSSRPPYDGNQYVMGICAVAGGPRIPDIQSIIDLFNSLLGTGENNPLANAIATIDAVVTAAETTVFGPDMKPMPQTTNENGTQTVTNADGSVVPAASIDPLTGKPTTPSTPVIAADGTPVSTDSPANPNAGNTNVKSNEDLC